MKVVCEYCDAYIESTDEKCPNCGAPNTHFARTASDTPKTIEQLKEYCIQKKLPLERMHVHIGENYQMPRAFGIYRDSNTGRYIVYKNKDSGERSIRYEGTDEAYAVNEIYMKIKDLVMDARENSPQPNRSYTPPQYQPTRNSSPNKRPWLKWVIIILIVLFIAGGGIKSVGRYLRPILGNSSSSSSSSTFTSNSWGNDAYDDDDDSGGFFSNLFDLDSDDDGSWFSSNDWDTDDDWDSSSDWDWSDSYDSYDYDSGYDWDSDW